MDGWITARPTSNPDHQIIHCRRRPLVSVVVRRTKKQQMKRVVISVYVVGGEKTKVERNLDMEFVHF